MVAWLRRVVPKEWSQVQLVRAHVRLEDGEEGIDESQCSLSLARAREQCKAAQFRLQAIDPEYRPQLSVDNSHGLNLDSYELLNAANDLLKLFKSEKVVNPLPALELEAGGTNPSEGEPPPL
jgi:hypothetical protein